MLSDAWSVLSNVKSKDVSNSKRNASLGFTQSFEKCGYFFHIFYLLGHYCSSFPVLSIKLGNSTLTSGLTLTNRALPCFTLLHKLFYSVPLLEPKAGRMGNKGIPFDMFFWLNEIALAHLIMGDGYRHGNALRIATHSFTLLEVIFLRNILTIKFGLECTVHTAKPAQYEIYIRARSMAKVRRLVEPHFVDSMLYKIEKRN